MARPLSNPEPTFKKYPDRGCEFYHECLSCIFTKCIYDETDTSVLKRKGHIPKEVREYRNQKILKEIEAGKPIEEIAKTFDVSSRTVERIVRLDGLD